MNFVIFKSSGTWFKVQSSKLPIHAIKLRKNKSKSFLTVNLEPGTVERWILVIAPFSIFKLWH